MINAGINVKDDNEPQPSDMCRRTTVNVSKGHLLKLFMDPGTDGVIAASVAHLYATHQEVLPNKTDHGRLTKAVIDLLARFRPPESETLSVDFMAKSDVISKILTLVWGRTDEIDSVRDCLRHFYETISSNGMLHF